MTEEGILLIDKPKGISSFDVIRRLRKGLGKKKMGHAGTLDPLASGLMIIGVGEGTKKLKEYIQLPKTYRTEILVGERRSTGDMEGEILDKKVVGSLGTEAVEKVLQAMIGVLRLPVPVYSAVKVGGRRMYKEAREGRKTIIPIRDMEIKDTRLLGMRKEGDCYIVEAEFDVESGVYIRSLAEEFGKRLGYPATVKELRRTKVGEFLIEEARQI
ncbi:MAG: tRNA pseudouridine(55) synthase TruB [Candidatus Paceibacterota bacterium]